MQNKGSIRLFAILLSLACIYYLTFTYVTHSVESDAEQFAIEAVNTPAVQETAKKHSGGDPGKLLTYVDSLTVLKTDMYLDSMKKQPVFLGMTYEKCKTKEINLGLDLRGGMNVTLEISIPEIIRGLANNNAPDPNFNEAIKDAVEKSRTSSKDLVTLFAESYKEKSPNSTLAANFQTIELKGKINRNTSDDEVVKFIHERVEEAIETTRKTLSARIDKFGVVQPNIQKLEGGTGRILVELPGVKDKDRVRKLLQGTANLEFWETYENSEVANSIGEANKRLKELYETAEKAAKGADTTLVANKTESPDTSKNKKDAEDLTSQLEKAKKDTSKTKGETAAKKNEKNPIYDILRPAVYQGDKNQLMLMPGPVVGYAREQDTAKMNELLSSKLIKDLLPKNLRFLWHFKPTKESKEVNIFELYAIKVTSRDGKAALSGDIISEARKNFDQMNGGSPVVSMNMTPEAANIWKHLTADAAGQDPKRCIAIVLDNNVYSAPRVQNEISGGSSQITGNFSNEEADDLVTVLSAGKFPATSRIVQETIVGPTLGKENIVKGFFSFAIALVLVLLFMGFYYNKAGWVADIALLANVFFVMGVLASLGAVLTMPGIAGIVLTIGLSVDANILIFERVREELALGKGMALAIKEGFSNAMSSIIDSNVTTLLLGIILYVFGTGPIQGFATTLIIGILTSLFCAIFITRLIFDGMLKRNNNISFYTSVTQNMFKNINVDFVGKRKFYYMFSGAIIALGIVFYFQKGFNLGVDFKGGYTYTVRFDEPQSAQDVKVVLEKAFDGVATEVKTAGGNNQLKITTSYLISENSTDAQTKVDERLNKGLDQFKGKRQIISQGKVGETISRDIKSKAVWAILFSCLVMFFYIFIRFKKWQYGLGAVVALFHDVAVVLSCYTIFNGVLPFALEIDQAFIAALLTVMGYSMTDTVVVFDRIREYLSDQGKADLDNHERHRIINYALNSTLSRTINTSLTIFFVLLAIFIFGGDVIKGFSFSLLIGIVIGTYSSICIATPVVIDFDKTGVEKPKAEKALA